MAKSTDKRYDDDWAKEKSREVVKGLIGRTLMSFRKPKQVSVLCFPGIDAREVTQVYDSMGIPRQNIVGLERDKWIAAEIEAKKLGIRVIPQSLEDYIDGQKEVDFDIVSLDYTQPIYDNQLFAIYSLLKKQRKNSFVLHVANSIRRDAHSDSLYATGISMADISYASRDAAEKDKFYYHMADIFTAFKDKKDEGQSRVFEKAHAYTRLIKGLFSGFGYNKDMKVSLKRLENAVLFLMGAEYEAGMQSYILQQIEDELQRDSTGKFLQRIIDTGFKLDMSRPLTCIPDEYIGMSLATNMLPALSFNRIAHIPRFAKLGEAIVDDTSKSLTQALLAQQKDESFYVNMSEYRYSYISESGCPMIGDVFFLKKPVYAIKHAQEMLASASYPREFEVTDVPLFAHGIINYNQAMIDITEQRIALNGVIETRERDFVGNASKPVLTKRKFLDELDAGRDAEYVREHYRGWRNKPLAQWQAHHTMGTYRDKPSAIEEDLGGEEDSDLEKITRDEAIDMLSSGISIDQIRSAYPTSFTVGQLRAYKAHLTMGTYKESGKEVASAAG